MLLRQEYEQVAKYDSYKKMRTDEEEYARPAQPPDTSSLGTVREAAAHCTECHLYKCGTQTVFGEGPKRAAMMLVGEQPGDYEDVAGKPFVGPAGKIMNRALEEAGIDRSQVYVTNAVKHFKWEPRGKRRIHRKPNSHPSSLLRQPDEESREREYKHFVSDLRAALRAAEKE